MHDVVSPKAPGIKQQKHVPLMPYPLFDAKAGLNCLMRITACLYATLDSQIPLAPSNLSSLNSTQLLSPTRSRLRFLDGTQLVGSVARHANVVVALENELNVAKFES